jgi:hypothetical protein
MQEYCILYVTKIIKIFKIAIKIVAVMLLRLSGLPTWKLVKKYLALETIFRRNGCPKALGKN